MAATAISGQVRRPAIRRPGLGRDDQRLVDLVRAGDDGAFEAIYDRYAPGLLAFCRHLLSSREEAEDAVQHSFGAAYRTLRASDDDIELRPWLYTIARNRCLSLLRARRTDVSLDVDEACGPHADGLADVVQLRSDLRELLEDLRQLPDDQRAALVLLEFGGLPHEEIAAVLDVRQGKTKALVFQAREGLMRARRARDLPCTEMREQLASLSGKVPRRSMLRRHVDRCPSCALFEAEVGRQRAGLALILPVLPTVGLKSIVLGSAIGRGAAVAGGGAGAGGGAAMLGGAGAGGASLTGAGGGSGVAALAGAGAGAGGSAGVASGGGILAGAAAGGVGGVRGDGDRRWRRHDRRRARREDGERRPDEGARRGRRRRRRRRHGRERPDADGRRAHAGGAADRRRDGAAVTGGLGASDGPRPCGRWSGRRRRRHAGAARGP